MNSKILEILSPEHIESVGRELWQQFYDDDVLYALPGGVVSRLIGELASELYPDEGEYELEEDFILEHGDGLAVLIHKIVDDLLDVDELTREAEENAEDYAERQEAALGRY